MAGHYEINRGKSLNGASSRILNGPCTKSRLLEGPETYRSCHFVAKNVDPKNLFKVPPAVVLLNCMRSGTVHFRGFFPELGFLAGFSLFIINFSGRISEAAMGGGMGC